MKRWRVRILVVLGVVVLAILFSLVGSRIHSRNAVEHYRDELRTAGEELDLIRLIPPAVSEESNSAALFLEAAKILGDNPWNVLGSNPPQAMRMAGPAWAVVGWRQPTVSDGRSGATNSWEDVRTALIPMQPALVLLRQIPAGSKFDFGLKYEDGFNLLLPQLAKYKASAQLLSADALLQLHSGQPDTALTNVLAIVQLVDASDDERLAISELVRIAVAAVAAAATWELLQTTNLSDAQLELLQSRWADPHFVVPFKKAMLVERAYASTTFQGFRQMDDLSQVWGVSSFGGVSGGAGSGGWLDALKGLGESAKDEAAQRLWKWSWSFQDELRNVQYNHLLIETIRRIETNGSFQAALAWRDDELTSRGLDQPPDNWLRSKIGESVGIFEDGITLGKAMDKILQAESGRSVLVTAIALKRYRTKHGRWPEDLTALVPEFASSIPTDPIDGQALRYRKSADDLYLLYSIGKDGKDDGGFSHPPDTRSFYWLQGMDWVWPQPLTD